MQRLQLLVQQREELLTLWAKADPTDRAPLVLEWMRLNEEIESAEDDK